MKLLLYTQLQTVEEKHNLVKDRILSLNIDSYKDQHEEVSKAVP